MSTPSVKPDRVPVTPATPIVSFSPVNFDVPGRLATMELRVVAPVTGDNLPIILFSHGHGGSNFLSSMRGYGPLIDFYAAHGFVVIIPTHQNSKTLALDPDGPEGPLFWRSRAQDMQFILGHLDEIEVAVPGLAGRVDKQQLVAVGHSLGGHTAALLAGMRVRDPNTGEIADFYEPRIKAAVMFSPPGNGADLAPLAAERFSVLRHNDFSQMRTPSLVLTGDKDFHPFFSERADWRTDAFKLSPGPKSLLTLVDTGHMFGGISGYDARETDDESPERVTEIQRITWAYLRTALYADDSAWDFVVRELASSENSIGSFDSK